MDVRAGNVTGSGANSAIRRYPKFSRRAAQRRERGEPAGSHATVGRRNSSLHPRYYDPADISVDRNKMCMPEEVESC